MGTIMRLGMICRTDNSGLGTLSWEFARHLKPDKVLMIKSPKNVGFPERYAEFDSREVQMQITELDYAWLLRDIDVLLSIETFYDWSLVAEAQKRGIKTALYTMFEMTPDILPMTPDLFICPSKLDYESFHEPKVFLPPPVATDRLHWQERKVAKNFIHTASHGGMNWRKGTKLFLEAIHFVKNPDVRFTVHTWQQLVCSDPRCEVKQVNYKNYWQVWREGDVLVYPQDYNGICLPVVEAMSVGMGVISTNIFPFNEYLPKELLFEPTEMYRTRAAHGLREVDAAKISAQDVARKIDEWALKDITEFSHYGKKWAEENSWEVLLPQYQEVLQNLCKSKPVGSAAKNV